jgi:hypothetical protein
MKHGPTDKSFLLLFFKKEESFFLFRVEGFNPLRWPFFLERKKQRPFACWV